MWAALSDETRRLAAGSKGVCHLPTMTIPRFWAEARAQHRQQRTQVTVRRFGWSQTSEGEAQANAQERAADALRRILSGEEVLRREPKLAYNGAEGVPIREEIVAEHGKVVITRNSYGALCLNTEQVLFADVDFAEPDRSFFGCGFSLLLLAGSAALAWNSSGFNLKLFLLLVLPSIVAGFGLEKLGSRWVSSARGGASKIAARRIEGFIRGHQDWRLRVYQTPAGLRVLVTHRTFSAEDPAVAGFFHALGTDPVYVTMCQRQKCFRARVSPKPWRIGIAAHLRPRPGIWPVRPEALPARRAWVDAYHAKAAAFASCRFERELGNGGMDANVRRVMELHDQLCRAESGLPIA